MAVEAEVTDWRLWLLAAGAVGSLLLGIHNTYNASKHRKDTDRNRDEIQRLEREHKARSIRLEEFRASVRDPVRISLSVVPSLARRVDSVAKTTKSIDDLQEELTDLNRETLEVIGQIFDALSAADQSKFAEGSDWSTGMPEAEDEIALAFNTAQDNTVSLALRLESLRNIHQTLLILKINVDERIDAGLKHYADASESVGR